MSRVQALELLHDHVGARLCVRYRVDADGQLRFADSHDSRPRPRPRWPSLAVFGLTGLFGCTAPQLGLPLAGMAEAPLEVRLEPVVVPEAVEPPSPITPMPLEPTQEHPEVEPCEAGCSGGSGVASQRDFSKVIELAPTANGDEPGVILGGMSFEWEDEPELSAREQRRERRRLRSGKSAVILVR